MNQISIPKRIFLFFIIILLCISVVRVAKLGIADIHAYSSYRAIRAWQLSPFEMSDKEWSEIQNDLEMARKFDPENPELLMALGLAHEGRFANSAVKFSDARESREQALVYYRQSVNLRPSWPYGWIDLALVKYRLGELDQEFYDAAALSLELGPWEPGVQKVIIEIGLHGWKDLNDEMHILVLDTIRKAIVHSDKKHVNMIVGLLKEYQILSYGCLSAKDDPYLKRLCNGKL